MSKKRRSVANANNGQKKKKIFVSYPVDEILDQRTNEKGEIEYLVKWTNYEDKDNQWVKKEHIEGIYMGRVF